MARFHVQRNLFGRATDPEDDEDDGTGLPSPKLLKVNARRMAGIKEGKDVLRSFPSPGESLHCVCTHRLDIACLIGCLLERCGT